MKPNLSQTSSEIIVLPDEHPDAFVDLVLAHKRKTADLTHDFTDDMLIVLC
jgi:hypothetical protein